MIGIDIVQIERIKQLIEKYGNKGLSRFLNEKEIALAKTAQTAAGFWAAKEACAKALQTGIGKECSFLDIQISKAKNGAPKIALRKPLIERFFILDISLSITHDGAYAVAVVAIEQDKSALSATDKIKQLDTITF
jgi:holo-[acyl-carrier protein] synthase